MKRTQLISVSLLLFALAAEGAEDPRQAMADGQQALAQTNFTEAAKQFAAAAQSAHTADLDPAAPHYNRGLALLGDGQFGPAAEQFQTAARTSDLSLQQKALFNRGTALFQAAGELEKASQTEPALKAMEESLGMFEQAMALDPRDSDPKVNFELATREKKRLEQEVQQQQQQQSSPDQNQQEKQDKSDDTDKNQPKPPDDPADKPEGQEGEPKPEDQQPPPSSEPTPGQDDPPPEQEQKQAQGQEMTREEASQLLDAMKEREQATREQMARDRLRSNMGRLPPVDKDW